MLYCLISTVNVTDCTVLTLCDGQLAVPASNCTPCGYVLEYYSAVFVCLSQLMFVILPYIYCIVTGCTVLTLCDSQLAVPVSNCTLCGYVLEYYSSLFVCLSQLMFVILPYKTKLNSVALVRERTILTERPPPAGEVSANFCG